jgi:uncharacterized protein (UPF0332 family)
MHADLIAQAKRLCKLDPNKPKQANLRRAVSAAYYALFHFLCDQACRAVIGSTNAQAPYRQVLMRAFSHAAVYAACNSFSGGNLKGSVSRGLPKQFSISSETRQIATALIELQGQRGTADYDLTQRFARSDVWALIRQAENAILRFQQLPSSDDKKFFLACLWAYSALANRKG